MIAVAQTGDNVWGVSLNGDELSMIQAVAKVADCDITDLLGRILAGGIAFMVNVADKAVVGNKAH